MIKLAITGALGRMGRVVLFLAGKMGEFEIVGAIERKGHPEIGRTLKSLGVLDLDLPLRDNLEIVIEDCDVVIDFTEPLSALRHFEIAKAKKKAIVIGTTGFSDSQMESILKEKDVRAVISPNMSIGVNLMFNLVKKVSAVLGKDYDVEIIEIHHRMKKDAPSGTALKLRDMVISGNSEIKWRPLYGRYGIVKEREKEEIGIMSVRGGDVVGEHTVIFFGQGERLEITHRATSRENFARGALLAAKWIAHKEEGIYSMEDVLGLSPSA
jgi:4-hydroxy-tetrahydrodipicolinate reductase